MRRAPLALAVAVVAAAGCYESPVPLDPAPQADIDPRAVGSWRCLPAAPDADAEPVTITIKPTRDRVYQADFIEDGKEQPDRYEAYASLVKGKPVVNVRDLKTAPGNDKAWVFARYELLSPDVLEIGIADDDSFKGVEATAAAIRKHFESRAADPRLFGGFCVCVRQKKP